MPVILGRAIRLSFGPGCLGRASYACDLTHSRCQLLWHGSPGFPNSVRSPALVRGHLAAVESPKSYPRVGCAVHLLLPADVVGGKFRRRRFKELESPERALGQTWN